MLQQRHPTEDGAVADSERIVAGHRPIVQNDQAVVDGATGDSGQWLDDPPPVGTAMPGAPSQFPWTEVSPAVAPVAAPSVASRRTFSWGQVLILLAGVASLVFGIGAVALAGLAGSVKAPVVEVFTYDHTPLLGLIEIGAGAVLVLCGLLPGGRWIAGPVGVAAIVGGALVIAELDWTKEWLATQQRFGWVAIAIGSVAYLGAMVPGKRRTVVDPLTGRPATR